MGVVTLTARAADAAAVLDRAREVMTVVVRSSGPPWPAPEVWARVLPAWFVQGCAAEPDPAAEAAWLSRWRRLPPADRSRLAERRSWSLQDWLYWLEPDQRQWWWWDGAVAGPHLCTVQVDVHGWPVPIGALRWLLRVAGAEEISDDA